MKRTILVLFTVALCIGTAACAPSANGVRQFSTPQGVVISADFTTLNYANVNASAIQPYCIKCHSGDDAAGDLSLETYDKVFAARADIVDQIQKGKMPRKMTMDPQAKDLLLKWIAANAPQI